MGDRGNIVIESKTKEPLLYMYTHWSGSVVHRTLAAALAKGESRWGDDAYLNRIIFQTLLDGDEGTTGFGLSTTMGDGGTEVYVCHDTNTVRFEDEAPLSFAEFVKKWNV